MIGTRLWKTEPIHNKGQDSKTPLFLIREVINKLKDMKYFNKLDLIWEYNNI